MEVVEGRDEGDRACSERGPLGADDASLGGRGVRPTSSPERALGDFTTTPAILRLVPVAIVIGALATGVALALLDMIGILTNLLYYQRLSIRLVSPDANRLGLLAVVIPIGGGPAIGSSRSAKRFPRGSPSGVSGSIRCRVTPVWSACCPGQRSWR